MDIRRAIAFAFRDPAWSRKLFVLMLALAPAATLAAWRSTLSPGAVVAGVPLAGPGAAVLFGIFGGMLAVPAQGYTLRITRDAARDQDLPLPAWSDGGGLLRDGARAWVVVTLWSLPDTLLRLVPGFGENDALPLRLAGLVLSVGLLVASPAAIGRLAATASLAAALDVLAVLATVRRNLGGYLGLLLATVVGSMLAFGVGGAVAYVALRAAGRDPGIADLAAAGVLAGLVASAPLQVVLAHLTGQVYRQAVSRAGGSRQTRRGKR